MHMGVLSPSWTFFTEREVAYAEIAWNGFVEWKWTANGIALAVETRSRRLWPESTNRKLNTALHN